MKKTVLVTGASSGFGREIAKLFQRNGWNVVATMRSPEKEAELSTLENVWVTKLDVQDAGSIKAAVCTAIDKVGRIDVVVNNAGYGLMGVFESSTREQIKRQFDVNLFGLMDVTKEVLPHLRSQGEGVIINVSSFGGVVGLPFGSLYNSTKFAVEGFSESLSHELFKFNIAVKIVEPGGVHTNFRAGLDMIKNEIPEYNPLMASFFANYTKPTEHLSKATAEDVAHTIYTAATDGKAQLRYVIGNDAQFYIDTKMNHGDQAFIQSIRNFFIK
ncbi:NADP-dependent 3-hydroxy acid dehydrogenase YdfG [Chryseolinea serpens]|uniref:NADP-dependent 3-hydroxy acid dehydrogenase YdfG n=1 Tax=Chryseolinea serpens TaxID=947013 RepID=A0A1M5U4P4_9BACT|nr:SDR family oxidoreductase [Chryseolinea serpens]SHH57939.1 NADP-dependent 3-hydroxy acid dehydrogenase YdfG [Chryseolinea serpens]